VTLPCPECAKRPYPCFEHDEELRAGEEDEDMLRLFAARWEARLARERAFVERLTRDAYFLGRRVAKGELLLKDAQALIGARVRTVDETLPIFAYVMPVETAEELAAEAFERGLESVRRRMA